MSYKDTRAGLLNTEKAIYKGVGEFDIPEILPLQDIDITDLEAVGINYMFKCKHPEKSILHFFLDDYQFERVWKEPNKYLPYLQKFKYVVAPDFSLYTDHPKAVQVFNHYRKHWCARYWQEHGVNVIPCICWSTPDSFSWCFDGEPKNAPVCISTIGGFGNHDCNKQGWVEGYDEMYRQLKPSHVIIFGKRYKETEKDCAMSVIHNEQLRRKLTLSARPVSDRDIFIPIINEEVIDDGEI